MTLKSLLDLLTTPRVLPEAAAVALPAADPNLSAPRVMRRALPSRGATLRQMELDFRPGLRPRGPAAPTGAATDDNA